MNGNVSEVEVEAAQGGETQFLPLRDGSIMRLWQQGKTIRVDRLGESATIGSAETAREGEAAGTPLVGSQ